MPIGKFQMLSRMASQAQTAPVTKLIACRSDASPATYIPSAMAEVIAVRTGSSQRQRATGTGGAAA
jgi:hypothetical protein